jgi:hypothetical protein
MTCRKRYVTDGKIVTMTGVTATIPTSSHSWNAIAGRDRAIGLAEQLGRKSWSSPIPTASFHLGLPSTMTIPGNHVSFWSREDFGIPIKPGVD